MEKRLKWLLVAGLLVPANANWQTFVGYVNENYHSFNFDTTGFAAPGVYVTDTANMGKVISKAELLLEGDFRQPDNAYLPDTVRAFTVRPFNESDTLLYYKKVDSVSQSIIAELVVSGDFKVAVTAVIDGAIYTDTCKLSLFQINSALKSACKGLFADTLPDGIQGSDVYIKITTKSSGLNWKTVNQSAGLKRLVGIFDSVSREILFPPALIVGYVKQEGIGYAAFHESTDMYEYLKIKGGVGLGSSLGQKSLIYGRLFLRDSTLIADSVVLADSNRRRTIAEAGYATAVSGYFKCYKLMTDNKLVYFSYSPPFRDDTISLSASVFNELSTRIAILRLGMLEKYYSHAGCCGVDGGMYYSTYLESRTDIWEYKTVEMDNQWKMMDSCFKKTAIEDRKIYSGGIVGLKAVPNPFSRNTHLEFVGLSETKESRLKMFAMDGRLVNSVKIELQDGRGAFDWNGRDNLGRALAAGVYLAQVSVGDRVMETKLMLAK